MHDDCADEDFVCEDVLEEVCRKNRELLAFEREMLKHYEEDGWRVAGIMDPEHDITEEIVTDTRETIRRLERSIELYESYILEPPQ